jgi:hypothetical protein
MMYMAISLPNFFYSLGKIGLDVYNFFLCLHPLVILVVLMRAMQVKAQSLERSSRRLCKEKNLEVEPCMTEMGLVHDKN